MCPGGEFPTAAWCHMIQKGYVTPTATSCQSPSGSCDIATATSCHPLTKAERFLPKIQELFQNNLTLCTESFIGNFSYIVDLPMHRLTIISPVKFIDSIMIDCVDLAYIYDNRRYFYMLALHVTFHKYCLAWQGHTELLYHVH